MHGRNHLLAAIVTIASALAANTATAQGIIHPSEGKTVETDGFRLELIAKKQNFGGPARSKDEDINSPKSVNIHPDGTKYYVNSLEGMRTVVFDFQTGKKLKVIKHTFTSADAELWAPDSGLFPFSYDKKDRNTFSGKPVESTFSHHGRYLWVPYYRRSYDINAQDPSAMAVIDTRTDEIIRLFETGPLPKMITTSPDGSRIAVTHWGNNTVGVLDISSDDPQDWKYTDCYVVDYKLQLNYSRTKPVNRDVGSGYCLRGTLFTPNGKYLLVGCMGGSGGIAVIDLRSSRYLGRLTGMMSNLRHIIYKNGYLYCSINSAGYVQRTSIRNIYEAIGNLTPDRKTAPVTIWENCKVHPGARTIVSSSDGRYIFAACNTASKISVVDTETMTMVAALDADSFPVGLDISDDDQYLFMTAQGRSNGGGNAVDIFRFTRK